MERATKSGLSRAAQKAVVRIGAKIRLAITISQRVASYLCRAPPPERLECEHGCGSRPTVASNSHCL